MTTDLNDLPENDDYATPAKKTSRKRAAQSAQEVANPVVAAKPKEQRYKIMVERCEAIPPGPWGLPIGVNGYFYYLKPGKVQEVPIGVIEVLDNAVETVAIVDPDSGTIVDFENRLRIPYRRMDQLAA